MKLREKDLQRLEVIASKVAMVKRISGDMVGLHGDCPICGNHTLRVILNNTDRSIHIICLKDCPSSEILDAMKVDPDILSDSWEGKQPRGRRKPKELEKNIAIDREFKELLPPLSEDEYLSLEESILSEGCREPITLWHGMVVDGCNRYEICKKHKIEFKTYSKTFKNRKAVKIWIVKNQLGRRNLAPEQMSYLRGVRYNLEKKEPHRPEGKGGQNDHLKSKTAEQIAQQTGVSARTVQRDGEFAEAVDKMSPEEKKEILSGKSKKTKKQITEKGQKKTNGKPRKVTTKIGPPSDGLLFAKMAIMDLEKIREGDTERNKAFASVMEWIEKADGEQASDPKTRLLKCLGLLQEPLPTDLDEVERQVLRSLAGSIARKLFVLFPDLTSPSPSGKTEQVGTELVLEKNGSGCYEANVGV